MMRLACSFTKSSSKYNPYKYPKIAKFRRDLVLLNLKDNNFISEDEFTNLKERSLNLKKRKIEIVNEANSYTEEVRRSINENYGFEKLYSQGLSIRTPLNINYQIHAIKSLRKGIEDYDRRHGWRGPISNKLKDKNWSKKLENIKLDPTLNWQIAEIIEINNNEIKFNFIDGVNKEVSSGNIKYNKLKWSLGKKNIEERFKIGDLIFVKKENNIYSLKQYPKVNGGIIVLDPYTGDVKALVGGFNFKSSEFNRVTQAKR